MRSQRHLAVLTLAACLASSGATAQTTRPAASRPANDPARLKELVIGIRQRDSAERRAATLNDIRTLLAADAASQALALNVLAQVADVKFDRAGLEAEVSQLLTSPAAEVRRGALMALPTVNPQPGNLDAVVKLAGDPDPSVRQTVMSSIAFIRQATHVTTPIGEPALTLLADPQKDVVVETARSLWGQPLTPEVEDKAIELSRFPNDQVPEGRSVAYWMHYFILSTRPQLSEKVARRLGEIARHPLLDQNWKGRAIWGLAHPASPQAADAVTDALVEELDNSLVAYNREWAVRGLLGVRTEKAMKKLQAVAASDESDEVRKLAARAVPKS